MTHSSTVSSTTTTRMQPQVIGTLAVLSLAGVTLLLASTPWGIGVGYDSVFYLSSAQSLLQGRGLSWPVGTGVFEPLIHYPPLYPLLLAGLGFLGFDLTFAARLAASVFFGANILLLGWFVARSSRFTWTGPLIAAAAMASPILLGVHLVAMTEGLFFCLLLLTILTLVNYVQSGRRNSYWLAVVFSALAALTRYVGPAIAAASFLTLLLFGRGEIKRRSRSGLVFVGSSLLPLLLWYGRNLLLAGSVSNRELSYHPLSLDSLKAALVTVAEWWISPDAGSSTKKLGLVFILAVICGFSVLILRRGYSGAGSEGRARKRHHLTIPLLLVLFMFFYATLLVTSLTFVDASTRLNDRILSPIYVLFLGFFGVLIGHALDRRGNPRWALVVSILLLGSLLAAYIPRTLNLIHVTREQGRGFTGRAWQTSETIALVNELKKGGVVYSSEALPLYYLTGQAAYWVPEKIDPLVAQEIPDYPARLAEMRRRLEEQGGYLILFERSFSRVEMPPFDEVVAGLELLHQMVDGSIWIHPSSNLP